MHIKDTKKVYRWKLLIKFEFYSVKPKNLFNTVGNDSKDRWQELKWNTKMFLV